MRTRYRGRWTKFESWFKEEHINLDDSELSAYFFLKHVADDEGRFEPKIKMLDTVSPRRFKGKWEEFLRKFKDEGHIIVYHISGIIVAQIVEWSTDQNIRAETPSILPAHPDFDKQKRLFEDEVERGVKVPYLEVIKLWNNICHGKNKTLLFVDPLSAQNPHEDERLKALATQWKHEKNNLIYWERLFRRVINSDFLTGKIPPKRSSVPMRATFGWVLTPKWTRSIMEGNYDNRELEKKSHEDEKQRKIDYELRTQERERTDETRRTIAGLDRGIKESLRYMALEELKIDYKEEHLTEQFIEVRMVEIYYRTHDNGS